MFRGGSYSCGRGYCSLPYEVRKQRKKVFFGENQKRGFFREEHTNTTQVNMADEGKLQKMEVDYSATVDEKIPQCSQTAKVCF